MSAVNKFKLRTTQILQQSKGFHLSLIDSHPQEHMAKIKMTSSLSYPNSIRMIIICTIYSSVYLFSNLTNVQGFHPLLQLPKYINSINTITSKRFISVNDYGAKGDGLTDDTKAFKVVWRIACSSPSPLKIVVPAKNSYLIKPVDFVGPCQSNVTLKISGTIIAPEYPHVWDGLDPHKWLFFHNVTHLTVEGGGVVNGMGQEWWAQSCKINVTNPCRHAPTAMTFHRCKNLKVRKLMMVNSQQMHMVFSHCVGVVASYLTVIAPAVSPNTDGFHISASTHVEIKDSIIGTGDDCISIVSNSTRIRVKNITCGPGHGISIGSLGKWNSWDHVHDVRVNGAILSNTENGVRIKTWQGGSGFASKITFQNVWMENVSNPIIIDQYYCDSPFPCPNQTSAVTIKKISFIGIKGTSATEEAIRFACSSNSPCKGLYLEDIQLVSYSGGITTSFCWEARGSSTGLIYPPPCLSCGERFIKQRVLSSSVLLSI